MTPKVGNQLRASGLAGLGARNGLNQTQHGIVLPDLTPAARITGVKIYNKMLSPSKEVKIIKKRME